jgi:putative chitinase
MNRAAFFAAVRASMFGGYFEQTQVDGIDAILNEWEAEGLTDPRWLAYMLATAYHETGKKFQAISENLNYSANGLVATFPRYFTLQVAANYARQPEKIANRAYANRMGNGDEASGDGWKFRGRGLCQITGRDNYRLFGIENDPDKALQLPVAVKIMTNGMTKGSFTTKKLSDYFHGDTADWVNARRIINGVDRANDIAGYGKKFLTAIEVAA